MVACQLPHNVGKVPSAPSEGSGNHLYCGMTVGNAWALAELCVAAAAGHALGILHGVAPLLPLKEQE